MADPPPGRSRPADYVHHPVDPALGGPILVSPPAGRGQVLVATDALLLQTERLARLHHTLIDGAAALDRADALAVGTVAAAAQASGAHATAAGLALRSAAELDAARVALRAAAAVAQRTDADLTGAIARYADAEEQQREQAMRLGAAFGIIWGPAIRAAILAALPVLLFAEVAGVGPDDLPLAPLKRWLLTHPELITDPGFVEGVRATSMSLDEAAGSIMGFPPGVAEQLAAQFGFTGVEAGAAYLLAAGAPLGLFRESPVSVSRVTTSAGDAGARGSVERLARVPEGDQVRIERYEAPGEPPRYVVYVGPTETFSPVATDEPWDLTSNVTGVAALDAGSLRATELAMHDAGITATDEVQFIGFSQGGLVATRLAASDSWNAAGLETYGAPAGGIALPSGLDGMAIRNSDDFVPALAGPQLDHNLLQVERRAFEPGSPIPIAEPAPAHQRQAYVATATVVDEARSDAVREQIAAMDRFTSDYTDREGSSVTVMTYHAQRGATRAMAAISGGSSP